MCNEFKAYHYEILGGLEWEEEATLKLVVFDKHRAKESYNCMEFINRLGDFLAKPQLSDSTPPSTNNRLVDRHLDFLEESCKSFRERSKLLNLLIRMC